MSPVPVLAQTGDWDWSFAREITPEIWDGMVETIKLTVVAISLALVAGLVLAILRRSRLRVVRWPVGLLIEFIRSTPLLVQLYFLFFVLPSLDVTLSPFSAAVFGLGLHYACYTSESYRAGIDNVARGQWEAAISINLSRAQTWRQVILPQAIPTVLPALGNYVVASLKDAPLASTITLAGILTAAQRIQSQTFRGLEPFTVAGLVFLAVSIPAALGVRQLEKRYGYTRE